MRRPTIGTVADSESPSTDDSPDPSEAAAEACVGGDPVLTSDEQSNPRAADGPDFESDAYLVGSSVVVAESEDQARTVRKERAVAMLTTGGVGSPFPDAGRDSLARKMADRMGP